MHKLVIACTPSDDRLNHRTKGAKTKMSSFHSLPYLLVF